METFAELKRICSYLANNKLTEEEVFNIIEPYQKRLYKFAWERGYHIRSFVQSRSKEAANTANRKISELEEERLEDPPLDINKIKSGTLITLDNGDVKPVEFLQKGEVIVIGELKFEIKGTERTKDNFKLIL
jgi:hypothetical protein